MSEKIEKELNFDQKHLDTKEIAPHKSEGIEEDLNFDNKYDNSQLGTRSSASPKAQKLLYDENRETHVEFFNTEREALERIYELKEKGISDSDMYVVVEREKDLTLLRKTTDVEVERTDSDYKEASKEKGFFAKFLDNIRGEDHVRSAFDRMNLRDDERDDYQEKVRQGQIMLYVDAAYENDYEEICRNCNENYKYDTRYYTISSSEIGKKSKEHENLSRDFSGKIVRKDSEKR